jgi:hypothetical protein
MNIPLPSTLKRTLGLGALLFSIFGSAAFGTYLLANTFSGVTLPFFPAWLSRELVVVLIVVGFGAWFMLTRETPAMHPFKERIPEVGRYEPPQQQYAPPPATTLESILERALTNNLLGSDLNVTLKLPDNTKLKIMGQEWEVNNAQIVIAKKPAPPMVPLAESEQEMPLQ